MTEHFRAPTTSRLANLADLCQRGYTIVEAYGQDDPLWTGVAGSKKERETTSLAAGSDPAWEGLGLLTPYAVAHLQLNAAADHLRSLGWLLPSCVEGGSMTPMVVGRATVETCARAWWLLDPKLSWRERMARSIADQLYSSGQAKSFARQRGVITSQISPSAKNIIAAARNLGITAKGGDNLEVNGEERPATSSLVGRFLRDTMYSEYARSIYAFDSAVSHGTVFALFQAYNLVEPVKIEGRPYFLRHIHEEFIVGAAGISAAAVLSVLYRLVKLMGWQQVRLMAFEARLRRAIEA